MQQLAVNLWFNDQAEEAATYYTSVFKNSRIITMARYPESAEEVSGQKAGSVMTVAFELNGLPMIALNGGPQFRFSEAVSLVVTCDDQSEVDYYWEKLSDGGEEGPCGWLKDKFGFSWQVVPTLLNELLSDSDQQKVDKVMAAMLQMKKIDSQQLQAAYDAA